jgi:hypothetical protein
MYVAYNRYLYEVILKSRKWITYLAFQPTSFPLFLVAQLASSPISSIACPLLAGSHDPDRSRRFRNLIPIQNWIRNEPKRATATPETESQRGRSRQHLSSTLCLLASPGCASLNLVDSPSSWLHGSLLGCASTCRLRLLTKTSVAGNSVPDTGSSSWNSGSHMCVPTVEDSRCCRNSEEVLVEFVQNSEDLIIVFVFQIV